MIKKRIFLIFIPVLFLLPVMAASSLSGFTGAKLMEYCQVGLDILDKNYGYVQSDSEYLQGVKTGICEGYLTSVNETSSLKIGRRGEKYQAYCMPAHFDMRRNMALVVKYIKDHPQQQAMPASSVVLKTYESYFPCR